MKITMIPVATVRGRTIWFPDIAVMPTLNKRAGLVCLTAGCMLLVMTFWPQTKVGQ